ncbi:NEL-type E3 ubiquitin ligase domain-containing protein [Pseudomonas sp. SDO528_S397]
MPTPHLELIQHNTPPWLLDTSGHRARALAAAPLTLAPWYRTVDHRPLKAANAHAWTTQNAVDRYLQQVQDVYAFAEPLLVKALKQRYQVEDDVHDTCLFLHLTTGAVIPGTTSHTVSLLDAALHNFADTQRFADSSCYISRPDARGHFVTRPVERKMSLAQFIALCRELDIGARYQRHLQQHLLPEALAETVIASQKATLKAAALMALHQQAISPATFYLLQRTLKGERGVMQFYRLHMLGTVLTGILLIAADLDTARDVSPVVAYIPHAPQHPVKDYPSTLALMADLREKLRDATYCTFFSRFVDQQQRQAFFGRLSQPHLGFAAVRIEGDLWPRLYAYSLDKIFNDAREWAVPTADADRRARWAWWDRFEQTVSALFNAALLVITPFVPLLGELMLAYTAYQLLDEIVEGVVDLAEGQALEAAEHLVGVVSDGVQLAAFGAAAQLLERLPSAFVEQLIPVQVNQATRLWNPDLRPYAQTTTLPATSRPDALGLHTHQGQTLLALEGEHYAVKLDPASGVHRIQHPRRADAYAPPVHHDARPGALSDYPLLRRVTPYAATLDDAQLARLQRTSGVDIDVLRATQVHKKPAPPLLLDSLKRLELSHQVEQLPQRLRSGEAVDEHTYWSPHLACELPGWPADCAIDVYEEADLRGEPLGFGEPDAPHRLAISRQDLNTGALAERIVGFLDAGQLRVLLGEKADAKALRERLAHELEQRRASVFDYLYANSEQVDSLYGQRVREQFPELPTSLVRSVVEQATPAEQQVMNTEQRLPLRLKNLAREQLLQARGAHAFEGLLEPARLTADSEQMILNTLSRHSDALGNTRLEVRKHRLTGAVRAAAGPRGAPRVRHLVRSEAGDYQLYDEEQALLPAPVDIYAAILHALPDAERHTLGTAGNDGATLHAWLIDTINAPQARRTLLQTQPTPPVPDTLVLRQMPMRRTRQWTVPQLPRPLSERVEAVYPYAAQSERDAYLLTLENPLQRRRFDELEAEKNRLQEDLRQWVTTRLPHEPQGADRTRLDLAQALIRTWEHNLHADEHGIGVTLDSVPLQGLLANLPPLRASFEHVQHLDLIDTGLLDADCRFLVNFPHLLHLDLRSNNLTRLPDAVPHLHYLSELGLSDNPIQWDDLSLGRLASMDRLRQLALSNNPRLTQAPDVGGMPHLRSLVLRHTGITEWPPGLFEHPRPAHFHLDLSGSPIRTVPRFLPWQPEAQWVANTRLDRHRLTLDAEEHLVSYRLAAGLDPYRSYPPRGDADFWLRDQPAPAQPALIELWHDLEQEHGSQGFFEVIKSLEQPEQFEDPEDRLRYDAGRQALTAKVWRMLHAMGGDEVLRKRLFLKASNPVTCADAGAHIFNAMGLEVELAEAHALPPGPARHRRLTQLAKGKTRLDRLNEQVRKDIALRVAPRDQGGWGMHFSTQLVEGQPGGVDEVEVYLAYQSALQARLDLPWVSGHMTYRGTAQVSDLQINNTYNALLALERGNGLVDGLLQQPFWETHLRDSHPGAFRASADRDAAVGERIDDLLFAQKAWAHARPEARPGLTAPLLALADELGVPHAQVLTGAEMDPQAYEQILEGAGGVPSEKSLARRLTFEALAALDAGPETRL